PVPIDDVVAAARPSPVQGDPRALARAADMLASAERPVIVTEHLGRHPEAVPELVALAEQLGAGVIDMNGRVCFPNRHPLNVTGSDEPLAEADLVLSLDVGDLFRLLNELDRETHQKRPRIKDGTKVVDVGLSELRQSKWAEDLGQFQPVALSIVADTRLAIPELRRLLRERDTRDRSPRRRAVEALHADIEKKWREQAKKDWDASPMTAPRLASEIWDVIRKYDWMLTANTLESWALRLWDVEGPNRHPGRSFGTATQIATSLGVALAYRGTDRLIVDVQPDGDLMYDPGALWTAAKHRLPILAVMYNNRAYYNDWEHQLRVADHRGTDKAKAYIGMDIEDPAPDFAMLARSMGWYAEGPITDPAQAGPAIARAADHVMRTRTPALVDTVVRRRALTKYR
ncbi:MAG TPA: thiamine pyrophosphate-dependent enzyme, partial [Candidatus Limnocylindria bacterium]|nr:thiamine pyrophosphate-dependent enzyme [Candidatus Limnocylindria bacterium]